MTVQELIQLAAADSEILSYEIQTCKIVIERGQTLVQNYTADLSINKNEKSIVFLTPMQNQFLNQNDNSSVLSKEFSFETLVNSEIQNGDLIKLECSDPFQMSEINTLISLNKSKLFIIRDSCYIFKEYSPVDHRPVFLKRAGDYPNNIPVLKNVEIIRLNKNGTILVEN